MSSVSITVYCSWLAGWLEVLIAWYIMFFG